MNESEILFSSKKTIFWAIGLFLIQIIAITGLSFYVITDNDIYYPHRLVSSLEYLDYFYDGDINRTELIQQARTAIFEELDRYSGYIEPNLMGMVTEEFTGAYSGIGITVIPTESGLSIMSVREEGPAGQAGIQTGDVIIRVDSTDLGEGVSYSALSLLRGEEGSPVKIMVYRYGLADTLEFELIRKKLDLIHIPYAGITDNHNLYIRLADFEAGLTYQLQDVIDTLFEPNRGSINGIVLDLRGNPGGLLGEAIASADLFLDKDHLIVGTKGRSKWADRTFYSSGEDITDGLPMVILVDRGSASSAEILSGALRYANRAVLVGDTTYGKGLVQQYSGFSDGSGMRLTTSRYYFEGGTFLNNPESKIIDSAAGLAPDYYIKSIASNKFPRELENSLLLREFALQNADQITMFKPMSNNAEQLFYKFIEFTHDNGFEYKSDMTELAGLTKDVVQFGNYDHKTLQAIDKIYKLAINSDQTAFEEYKDYIKTRLFQIALEIKVGLPESYRSAIIPFRTEIILAEKIIADNPKMSHE
ncbi:MAG: S41 family peptidase [Candidatus Zixiibacteriota bacterium]